MFNRIRQVAPMYLHGRGHGHHLANTIQPFVCSGDAVLCQITLTTCFVTYDNTETCNWSLHWKNNSSVKSFYKFKRCL